MIDESLYTALTEHPVIAPLLAASDAVYADELPQGSALPAIVYRINDGMPGDGFGETSLTPWEFELVVYAEQRSTMRAVDNAVADYFHQLQGVFGASTVTGGRVVAINRTTEEDPRMHAAFLQISLIERN